MSALTTAPSRGQSLVEFSLVVGLLMLLVMGTAQVAVALHYRSGLQLAAQERHRRFERLPLLGLVVLHDTALRSILRMPLATSMTPSTLA